MARVFLDYVTEPSSSGLRIYGIYFNDTTKVVEADFIKIFDFLAGDAVTYLPDFAFGGKMYDECIGADRYEVFKKGVFPFGIVVPTLNSPVCAAAVLKSVLYRFDTGPSGPLGSDIEDVCGMDGVAYLYYYGVIEVGSVLYDNEDLDLLPYNGSGWFRIGETAYRINASSEVITITPAGCSTVAPLPELPDLPDIDAAAKLHLPQATAIRFIKDQVNTYQTGDNTLFNEQEYPGIIPRKFDQIIAINQQVTIQFGSSYATNVVKIYNADTNALVSTITPTKVLTNLNQEMEVPGFAVSEPGLVGIQLYFPNYPFPDFAKSGNKVNVLGNQVSGQYNVISVQEGQGSARGSRVLVADFTILTPSPVGVTVTGKYNALPYDTYEAVISRSVSGRFYAKIECSDPVFDEVSATSEPFEVTDDLSEYLEVNYTNENDAYGCYYGADLVHRLWIKSRLFDTFPGGEKTFNRETSAKLVKLDEFITKSLAWKIYSIPPYLVTQLSIGLAHDRFSISGVDYQTEDAPEPEYFTSHNLANMQVRLEEVDFTARNREAGTIDSSDSFLLINNAGNRLLINP